MFQNSGFILLQNCRRFIQNDQRGSLHVGINRHGPCNFHHLPVHKGQIADLALGIEVDADFLQGRSGLAVQPRPVFVANTARISLVEIFSHRQVGKQRLFLMHHTNSGFDGIIGAAEFHLHAVDFHLAFVRLHNACEDFQQCGFACTIFTDKADDFAALDFERYGFDS